MAVPTSQSLVQVAFQDIWDAFIAVQSACIMIQSATASGAAASANNFLTLADYCIRLKTLVANDQAKPALWNAIVSYASNAAPGGMTLADLTAAYNAANAVLNALASEYPRDASGHLLDRTYNLNTGVSWITLTAAQMPNTMTAIPGYLATLA